MDARRGNFRERGYHSGWDKFRKAFLAEHPLCSDCEREGVARAATDVHHIEKVRDNPTRLLDPENCMGLCGEHHKRRTAKGE